MHLVPTKVLPCSSEKTQGSGLLPAPNQLLLCNPRGEIETTPRIAFASNKTRLLKGRIINKTSVLILLGQKKTQPTDAMIHLRDKFPAVDLHLSRRTSHQHQLQGTCSLGTSAPSLCCWRWCMQSHGCRFRTAAWISLGALPRPVPLQLLSACA